MTDEAPTDGPAPKTIEAFAHPAGSIAVGVPGGATGWRGTVLNIHIAPAASYEMEELTEAHCVAGRGIKGDRYYLGNGTYSPKPDTREISLIEQEALDAMSRNDPPLQGGPIKLLPGDHRRNLTVRGVPLNHLVGRRFRVGDVILRGGRLSFPCKYIEELLGQPVYLPLYNRAGLNCGIERGGVIRPGDVVEMLG
ncbi:MOSC domain-containing protein [Hansschlegelia quercus]|uniref:MOSC domain-containing protein n=1 Tax=Hansschlegelia quercus TaxID=2528245 RepID=A0A4Q9GHR7_9HYPH|nr:MOSC domain-containing protein [Hansschlegelia quercus]TBN53548.1 MOSC domain-containing protein [Hansschlegelia quercus]